MSRLKDDDCLEQLQILPTHEVVERWRRLFRKEPPTRIRKDLMIRVVAHRMQEQEFGGLSAASVRRLQKMASAVESNPTASISNRPPMKSGTRLVRQWKDRVHVVNVEGNQFEYRGDYYESLSEIARRITGTRWSGPLFVGLKAKQSSNLREAN
jgi:hypothetical protein